MLSAAPLPPERERELFLDGIRLFNEAEYFEAHEVWEEIWKAADGADRTFYQGLIQCAVAMEHMRRGNASGARNLFRKTQKKMAPLPRVYRGIDIWNLMEQVARALSPTIDPPHESGRLLAARPEIVLAP